MLQQVYYLGSAHGPEQSFVVASLLRRPAYLAVGHFLSSLLYLTHCESDQTAPYRTCLFHDCSSFWQAVFSEQEHFVRLPHYSTFQVAFPAEQSAFPVLLYLAVLR